MRRLSKSEGAFILNMTIFLIGMNLAAGVITEIGLFEMRRYDLTETQCVNLPTDTPAGFAGVWTAGAGGNGYCTLSSFVKNQYESQLDNKIREQVCVDPAPGVPCDPKTYQDEGVPNSIVDTIQKTLGDVSAALSTTVGVFSAAIISPFGWITEAWIQCSADASSAHCTDADKAQAQSWDQIIDYIQIPVYLMYGLFIIQIIMNRSFRGVT